MVMIMGVVMVVAHVASPVLGLLEVAGFGPVQVRSHFCNWKRSTAASQGLYGLRHYYKKARTP